MSLCEGNEETLIEIGMPIAKLHPPMEITLAPSSVLTYSHIESKRAYDEAEKTGGRVVLPEPDQLFIDIDSEEADNIFRRQFGKFKTLVDNYAQIIYDGPSKSGEEGHRHIIIKLSGAIDPKDRILNQVLLGSDLLREFLSYVRVLENDPHPTLFIENERTLETD